MSDLERRFTSGRVELRLAAPEKRTIGGYAAKFNTPSKNLGGFIERIDSGFFNQSRGDGWPEVIARYNHDDNMLLGTTAASTLRLSVDNVGLQYEVDPPVSREDVYELVQRGDVVKSSFAFQMFEDDWGTDKDTGFPMRTLLGGHLVDVAPVNVPAYSDTSVGLRSLENASVGLRSLARKFDADIEEVRKLAAANELAKFFSRTDGSPAVPKKLSAAARLAQAKAIRP
jgi:HK97 family phage prohead protease